MYMAPLKTDDLSRYNALSRKSGTIFNSANWLSLFGNDIKAVGIYNNNDELIGGFHLYIEKRFGLKICRDAPYTPHCGPFLKITSKNRVAIMDTWKKTISLMAEYIENLRLPLVSISLDKPVTDMQPFIWKSYKVTPRYTYLIDLTASVDDILRNMSPERRNDIKKAEKNGINVECR